MARERTWHGSLNNEYTATSALDFTRYELWVLKAMLCGQLGGLTLGLWSVFSSSDSSTAGNADGPGTDRWLSTYDGTKIVSGSFNSTINSWVVLKSPTSLTPLGVSFYLTIAFDVNSNSAANIYLAKTAPTAGTTLKRPTSTDEWRLSAAAGQAWNGAPSAPIMNRFNMLLTTTGDFVFFAGTNQKTFELGVVVVNPVGCDVTDNFPLWGYKNYTAGSSQGGFDGSSVVSGTIPSHNNPGTASTVTSVLAQDVPAHTEHPDMLTGKAWAQPSYLVVQNASNWHLRGRLPDMHFIPKSSGSIVTYPGGVMRSGGVIEYVAIGCFWLPLDTVPLFV